MSMSRYVMMATLMGTVAAGAACTDRAVDDAKKGAGTAIDATRSGAEKAVDATKTAAAETADVAKDVAKKTAETTRDVAGEVAATSKEVASAVNDTWITTKLKAKFADETVLKGSDINVDTSDHLVTLKGTVLTSAAKARAEAIARGTEGVARVVNQLVVK